MSGTSIIAQIFVPLNLSCAKDFWNLISIDLVYKLKKIVGSNIFSAVH